MKIIVKSLVCIFLLVCSYPGFSASNVKVLGLFSNKVLLSIDGQHKLLKVGQQYQDVEVISAHSKQCTLKIGGEYKTLALGSDVGVKFKPLAEPVVKVRKDEKGMYRVQGKINGKGVKFLIDTGATQLAMNQQQAKALGLEYNTAQKLPVDTASGKAFAFQVTLRKVSIGGITLYDIPALILEGEAPREVLLGMSFLKHIEMDDENTYLKLKKRY